MPFIYQRLFASNAKQKREAIQMIIIHSNFVLEAEKTVTVGCGPCHWDFSTETVCENLAL